MDYLVTVGFVFLCLVGGLTMYCLVLFWVWWWLVFSRFGVCYALGLVLVSGFSVDYCVLVVPLFVFGFYCLLEIWVCVCGGGVCCVAVCWFV